MCRWQTGSMVVAKKDNPKANSGSGGQSSRLQAGNECNGSGQGRICRHHHDCSQKVGLHRWREQFEVREALGRTTRGAWATRLECATDSDRRHHTADKPSRCLLSLVASRRARRTEGGVQAGEQDPERLWSTAGTGLCSRSPNGQTTCPGHQHPTGKPMQRHRARPGSVVLVSSLFFCINERARRRGVPRPGCVANAHPLRWQIGPMP
ncbi:uncharacterized protein IWZ02DRAFT_19208 [Phyllosticta citriasiana]|uniref:uncharacterized protein n=1 Tax=Phyllosticta citriasiana TaxID=595635 RepID=UPI0030FD8524